MSVDYLILTIIGALGFLSYVIVAPKKRDGDFYLQLFCQSLTWLNSLIMVRLHVLTFAQKNF